MYGLEYDLELFNIVAVDDFNMGAPCVNLCQFAPCVNLPV